jgi:uncharacterized Zn finger protein (UPF0148 family)
MNCNCISNIEKKIQASIEEQLGVSAKVECQATGFTFGQSVRLQHITLFKVTADAKGYKKGKLTNVLASFCPFCGRSTKEEQPDKTGAEMIAEERRRQIDIEGFKPERDAENSGRELAMAARCYLAQYVERAWLLEEFNDGAQLYEADAEDLPNDWPEAWDPDLWKPKNPIRDLVRAGALIAAEIDRLQRIQKAQPAEGQKWLINTL